MDEPSDGTSTARVPARDRNEYWRQVVCRTFVELEVTHQTAAGYRGSPRLRRPRRPVGRERRSDAGTRRTRELRGRLLAERSDQHRRPFELVAGQGVGRGLQPDGQTSDDRIDSSGQQH